MLAFHWTFSSFVVAVLVVVAVVVLLIFPGTILYKNSYTEIYTNSDRVGIGCG